MFNDMGKDKHTDLQTQVYIETESHSLEANLMDFTLKNYKLCYLKLN